MNFTRDQRIAVYLSVAEPAQVWRLLDTFTPQRFARLLQVKLELGCVAPDDLELFRAGAADRFDPETFRDSQLWIRPGRALTAEALDTLSPSLLLGCVLGLMSAGVRARLLGVLEPHLAQLVRRRVQQAWELTPAARERLGERVKFDPEMFDCFGTRAASTLAFWLLERLFFGVVQVSTVCELSPLTSYVVRARKNPLRHPASAAAAGLELQDLSRLTRLAILLMSLRPEVSGAVFKTFSLEMVQALTLEISKLPPVDPALRACVVQEVTHMTCEEVERIADPAVLSEIVLRWYEE